MFTLHNGDCLQYMRSLQSESFDCIVTDPPYGLDFPYAEYSDTRENLIALVNSFMPEALRVAKRVYVLCGTTQISLYPQPDWVVSIIWNTTGSFGKYGYSQWSPVLCYGNDLSGFGNVNGITKSDVLRINGGGGVGFTRGKDEKLHTCPKPITMMDKVIERFTNIGESVFDPFMGSGTTGVSSVSKQRYFTGCEMTAEYFAIAEKRVKEASLQQHLFTPSNNACSGQGDSAAQSEFILP